MKKSIYSLLPARPRRSYFVTSAVLFIVAVYLWKGILFAPSGNLKVTFIDVGQGASTLIEAPCGAVIMVDAGGKLPFYGVPEETGERIILPLLRQEGIKKLDLAVITHPHEDHFGGFIPLIDKVDIDLFVISPVPGESAYYDQLLEKVQMAGIAIEEAGAGEIWRCGSDLVIELYNPPEKLIKNTGSDLNNNSLVFKLSFGEMKFLFTGDIEDTSVGDLLRRQKDLQADVLQVPHHGGYLEQMPALLQQVEPCLAVIQVGPNPFGHPHPFVIESLEEAGVEIFRNDWHGAVVLETDGSSVEVYITEKPSPALVQ